MVVFINSIFARFSCKCFQMRAKSDLCPIQYWQYYFWKDALTVFWIFPMWLSLNDDFCLNLPRSRSVVSSLSWSRSIRPLAYSIIVLYFISSKVSFSWSNCWYDENVNRWKCYWWKLFLCSINLLWIFDISDKNFRWDCSKSSIARMFSVKLLVSIQYYRSNGKFLWHVI